MSHDDRRDTITTCKPLLRELAELYFSAKRACAAKTLQLTVEPTAESIKKAEKRLQALKDKVEDNTQLNLLCQRLGLEKDEALRRAASILDAFCLSITGVANISSSDKLDQELLLWLAIGGYGPFNQDSGCQQVPSMRS